jgi:hypothetical protein
MKICAKCKESKSKSEFGFKEKGRLQPYCRPCNNEHNREYYANNKEKQKSVVLARNQRYRNELKIWIRDLKESSPCLDCKISYPWYVMDYDHIGDDKEFNISYMVASVYSRANIEKEIAKCELVCANCHRERTFNRDSLDI